MNANDFILHNVPRRCVLESAVIEWAARERGLDVDRVKRATALVRISGAWVPFVRLHGPDSSTVARWIGSQIDVQRTLGRDHSLPFPRWSAFTAEEPDAALRYAERIGWPVTVRQAALKRPRSGTARSRNQQEFRANWNDTARALRKSRSTQHVVVEEHLNGLHLQLFVLDGELVAATHVVPANVVGDGSRSVERLIKRKNRERAQHPYLRNYRIPTDLSDLDELIDASRDLGYVPGRDELVGLHEQPGHGVDLVDVTTSIDSNVVKLAVEAVDMIPGLPYATVDIVVTDNGGPVVDAIRYEAPPVAQFPTHGQARDVGGAIIDYHLANPRWKAARATPHQLVPVG